VCGVEPDQHFVRDLRVAGLVGAHQSQAVAAQQWGKSVNQEEDCKDKKHGYFADGGPGWQPLFGLTAQIRNSRFQGRFHFQQFSNERAAACFVQKNISQLCSVRLEEAGLAAHFSHSKNAKMVLKFQQGQG
jgi:hypothetical protein